MGHQVVGQSGHSEQLHTQAGNGVAVVVVVDDEVLHECVVAIGESRSEVSLAHVLE